MRHRKRIAIGAAVVVALAVVTGVARAGVTGGPAPDVEFKTGGAFSTPSGSYVTVTSSSFTGGGGVIAVQFSAAGWVQDWKSGGVFAGKNYASLRARVLVNGTPLAPGAVVLFDNTGKIGIQAPRPTSASFEWAGVVGADHFTLTVQHD